MIYSNFAGPWARGLLARDVVVKLILWDWPTGPGRFRPSPALAFSGKQAVILVLDLTNERCLEDVDHWLHMMKARDEIRTRLLLGNKADLEHNVSSEEAEAFASSRGMQPAFKTLSQTFRS